LSHQPFLLISTYRFARAGLNKINGLGIRSKTASAPILARCDNATFTITGDLINQGTVQLGSGDSIGNVLHVNGSYFGGAGSTLALNTFLGGDGSPSDRLVINGGGAAATGNTSVHVTNGHCHI
jgi:hypothetical protein